MAIGQTVHGIWRFFVKMATVRHLGVVTSMFGPPMKSIWQSLLLCEICLVQLFL